MGTISTWIIAALRNEVCFTLEELNEQVEQKLEAFNHRRFSKKDGTRFSVFEAEEKFAMSPLPPKPYKMAEWRMVKVRLDYHVSVECAITLCHMNSSANKYRFDYLETLSRFSSTICGSPAMLDCLESLVSSQRFRSICQINHRLYLEQTPENARQWAEEIGEQTVAILDYLLESYLVEKQALSAIFTLKKSRQKYTKYEIERACKEVRSVSLHPTDKLIQNQLKVNKKQELLARKEQQGTKSEYGFTRGAAYWEDK
ncbi:transposase [Candidatus Enterococcus ferrettii]|uniref:transposase n=1 Tax=Candidatus Enterococcus ferrettii TaxID=2815324 RepID=UPI001F60F562|nr:transposase [Enterococcus sp. 665A]